MREIRDRWQKSDLVSKITMAAFVAQQAWTIGNAVAPKVKHWWDKNRWQELRVKSDCSFYFDVLAWLVRKKTEQLMPVRDIVSAARTSYVELSEDGEAPAPFLVIPGINQPVETAFQGRKVLVTRTDASNQPGTEKSSTSSRIIPDTITIKIETPKKEIADALVEEIVAEAKRQKDRGVNLRHFMWGCWRLLRKVDWGQRQAILPEGQYEQLHSDLTWFFANHAWYKERGIPYQRGYALHGTAGNGKTTTAITLATAFGLDLCILNLGSKLMTDEALQEAISGMPPRAALLLEDIDCAFTNREGAGDLTFSGVLNALDGAMSAEGRVAFITTNHMDRLDPALLRPGRIDRKVLIENPDRYQIETLIHRFYPAQSMAPTAGPFLGKSMAEIQEILVRDAMAQL